MSMLIWLALGLVGVLISLLVFSLSEKNGITITVGWVVIGLLGCSLGVLSFMWGILITFIFIAELIAEKYKTFFDKEVFRIKK